MWYCKFKEFDSCSACNGVQRHLCRFQHEYHIYLCQLVFSSYEGIVFIKGGGNE